MAVKAPSGPGSTPPPGAQTDTPTKLDQIKAGMGSAASTIANWGPVKRTTESSYFGYLVMPLSNVVSFLRGNWVRLSEKVFGPRNLPGTIDVLVPGTIFGSFWPTLKKEPIERALRHHWTTTAKVKAEGYTDEQIQGNGWKLVTIKGVETTVKYAIEKGLMTPEEAIASKHLTEVQAKIQGWVMIPNPSKGWFSGPDTILLRKAIEGGYMSVADAVSAGHFTQDHAAAADWIEKK